MECVVGAGNALAQDNLPYVPTEQTVEGNPNYTEVGRTCGMVGHAAAFVQGIAEIAGGFGAGMVGMAECVTVLFCPVGVVTVVAGGALVLHGGMTATKGFLGVVPGCWNGFLGFVTSAADGGAGIVQRMSMGSGGTTPNPSNGLINPSGRAISDSEQAVADMLIDEGKIVEIVPESTVRTADFIVDGINTELKTVNNITSKDIRGAMTRRILDGAGQAENIIVDARGQQGLTQELAERAIGGAYGVEKGTNLNRIRNIRIIGDGFDINISYNP